MLLGHKAYVHNIGVTWHECDQEKCNYQCKQANDLKKHKEFVHDIGSNECECCCKNRNSQNQGSKMQLDASSPLLRHEVAFVLGQLQHPASLEYLEASLRRQGEHVAIWR